jgi:hypothetical protein
LNGSVAWCDGFLKQAVAYYDSLGVKVERVMTDNGSCGAADAKSPRRRIWQAKFGLDERGREERSCNPSTPSSLNRLTHLPPVFGVV